MAAAALCLILINIFVQFAIYSFGLKKEWFLLFNMDKEMNIPTIYSSFLFLTCGGFIKLVIKNINPEKHKLLKKWNALQWLFVFLAADEALQIHEAFTISYFKNLLPAALSVVWVIPYGILVIFSFIYFKPLLASMPKRVRNLSLLAGFVYVSGAIGIEIVGNLLVKTGDIKLHGISYGLISTLEESMEITGLIIFIYALITYIFSYQKQTLKINLQISADNPSKT